MPHRYIRRAIPEDLPGIIALDHLAGGSARHTGIQRATMNHETFVVEEYSEVIAYGVLEYTFFGNGFISMVYVDERHRRKGAGEVLVRHLVEVCSTPKVFSSTNLSNTCMHALFRKLGFEGSGMVHHLDEGDPEVIYVRLPDGEC